MNLEVILNTYERKARYYPSLLTVSPIIIWLYLWFPEISSLEGTFISLIVGLGISIPLSVLARTLGKKKQDKLVAQWGALPATLILRHNDNTLNIDTKKRYHQKLRLLTNLDIPTENEEVNNPSVANRIYDSCIDYLRQSTRDRTKYSLVFNENIYYGQLRNLLGLKPLGLFICISLLIIQLLLIYNNYGIGINISAVPILKIISILFTISFIIFWLFFVSPIQVYNAGINYGRALLECCEEIE
ncbi:hypothetical protein JEG43_02740 [Anoxybacillus sp. LAT_35]|uniref:hypothetical protein n=1 Tax=unclassified Anoxybacillus TaxID=2639704 RepID=UPI001ED9F916|nr:MULTISPECIES: hypothetical protein [unclassified Anoxybacillus]MCG5026623.1 hypothetical protein [Anoxybacillus flavithermus]MCG3085848.1 hypothetical protein [Anoxybacillus sp. LAT27]MCG3086301.1 hypothetical protein [Anoxybacillus sp. LAT27]MCG6171719.1 hypothetical protein [Anoxybacillus sp. LAT_11]MCG6176186.1 hypothetical protein [Anoxybacillus sp. LAT_31]